MSTAKTNMVLLPASHDQRIGGEQLIQIEAAPGVTNPKAPAVKREAEEEWGRSRETVYAEHFRKLTEGAGGTKPLSEWWILVG